MRAGVTRASSSASRPAAVEQQVGALGRDPDARRRSRRAAASRTGSGTWSSSHRAKPSMKPLAMCWTTRIGIGKPAGSPASTAASACGPPAEAQIPMTEAPRRLPRSPACPAPARGPPRGWRITRTRLSSFTRLRKARARRRRDRAGRACPWRSTSSAPAPSEASAALRPAVHAAGEHEDRDGLDAHDLLDRVPARHAGQLEVHRHEVRLGLELRQPGDRLLGAGQTPTTSISGSRASSRDSPAA